MKCPFVIKVCTKCKRILVANKINYRKEKKGKWGLRSSCIKCEKKYRDEHKEEISEYKKQWYKNNKNEILNKQKESYENNREEKLNYQKQYYEKCKDKKINYQRQYYKENKNTISKKSKRYRQENPHIAFNIHNKRRLREESQGNGITKEQWLEMMEFFDFKCAYSGEYLGGTINEHRTIDHIIPLALNGVNEIWNLVPMSRSLNSSKNIKDMLEWYKEQPFYSEERLNRIYEWIGYAYNKWCNGE